MLELTFPLGVFVGVLGTVFAILLISFVASYFS